MSDNQGTVSSGHVPENGPFAKLGAEIDNVLRCVMPSDQVIEHFSNARIELLKGIRAIVDARIDRLSSEGKKGVSIKIE